MGLCKECRFWATRLDIRNRRWNTCKLIDWVERDEEIGKSSAAYFADADDDTGLDAEVMTGPEFGCVNFQANA